MPTLPVASWCFARAQMVRLALAVALLGAACAPRPLNGGSGGETTASTPTAETPSAAPQSSAAAARQLRRPRPIPTADSAATDKQSAPAPAPPPLLSGLLAGALPDPNGSYGVVLEDLASGAQTGVNETSVFPSASLYKLAVAWMAMREVDAGTLNLDAELPILDEDAVEAEPDGGLAVGDTPTVRDALESMLSLSSNNAAHAFLRVLGRAALGQEMDRIGLTQTRVPDDDVAVTTAADMAQLLRLIATSPQLSASSRELLLGALTNIAGPDALRDTLPETVDIIDKTGNLDDASNVGALLESSRATLILVVLDHEVDPGDARGVIGQLGLAAFRSLLQ